MSRWRGGAAFALALMLALSSPRAAAFPELADEEWQRLDRGDVVVKRRSLPDYPWPEVTAYKRVEATPDEVMAVYVDFDRQAFYFPRLVTSRIVRQVGPRSWHVFYEYKMPVLRERYLMQITAGRAGDGYRASWDLIDARHVERLSGEMKVEPIRSATLLLYTNRVDPGMLGRLFGSPESAAERLGQTVQALAARVERLRTAESSTLDELVRAWKAMLNAP